MILTLKLVAQYIPISLLELNTFGHAVCAVIIYILWWDKPFEVDYPTVVRSQPLLDIYALAWIRSFRSSSVKLWKEEFEARLDNAEQFHKLEEVGLIHSCWCQLTLLSTPESKASDGHAETLYIDKSVCAHKYPATP